MADDMLIGVGVKADFSSLKTEAKASADALKKAEAEWKEAFQQLGQAAEKGSVQAQEALKQYENELSQAQARAAAASAAMAQSQTAVASAASHTVPPMAAASGVLREMSGNFDHNVRAAERFLSTTLGLGPVLQAAFPVVGALAFAGVLVDIGEEIDKLYEKNISLTAANKELFDSFQKLKERDLLNVESIETANKRLDQTNEKGARLRETAQGLHDASFKDLFSQLGQVAQGNVGGLAVDVSGLLTAKKATEDGNKATLESIALTAETVKLKHQLQIEAIEAAHAGDLALEPEERINATLQKRLAINQENQNFTREQERAMGNPVSRDTGATQRELADLTAQREAAAKLAKLKPAEQMRADKEEFDRLKIDHKLTLDEERSFWETRLANYREKSAEYAEILGKIAQITDQERKAEERALKEGRKEAADEAIAAKRKELEEAEKANEENTRYWEQLLKQDEEAAASATKSAEVRIEAAAKVAEARVQYQLAAGVISQEAAAHELARIKAKAYEDQIAALREELRRLQQIEGQGGNNEPRQQEVQTKITQLGGDRDAALIQGAARSATAFERPWITAMRTIDRQWMSTMDSILRGQQSIAQGSARLLNDMIIDVINALTQMAFKWAEHYILIHVLHASSKAQDAAIDTAAATTQAATAAVANVSTAAGYAAVAAAGALAATAAIPIIGPELAPGVAAATYAQGMGFAALASAAGGWGTVPADTLALIHKNEMVLPSSIAEGVRGMVSSGSPNSSRSNNTFVNARVSQHFPGAKAASSARETRSAVQGLARRGKLAIG